MLKNVSIYTVSICIFYVLWCYFTVTPLGVHACVSLCHLIVPPATWEAVETEMSSVRLQLVVELTGPVLHGNHLRLLFQPHLSPPSARASMESSSSFTSFFLLGVRLRQSHRSPVICILMKGIVDQTETPGDKAVCRDEMWLRLIFLEVIECFHCSLQQWSVPHPLKCWTSIRENWRN